MKRNRILEYEAKRIIFGYIVAMVVIAGIYIIVMNFFGEHTTMESLEIGMLNGFLVSVTTTERELSRTMVFQFCRKKIYKYQLVICSMKAGVFALLQSVLHTVFRENYVKELLDPEIISKGAYYSPSWFELFLSDFLWLFLIIGIATLIKSNVVKCSIFTRVEETPQLKFRRSEKKREGKKRYRLFSFLGKLGDVFGWIVSLVGLLELYVCQLSFPFHRRLLLMIVAGIFCVLLCFFLKKRYQPKYI